MSNVHINVQYMQEPNIILYYHFCDFAAFLNTCTRTRVNFDKKGSLIIDEVRVCQLAFHHSLLPQVRTCHGDVISQPISGKYVHQVNESFA